MRKRTTIGTLAVLGAALGLIFGSFSVAGAAGSQAAAGDEAQSTTAPSQDGWLTLSAQSANQDEGHEPGEHGRDNKPENDGNPDDPPCDADHGHPGDNAPQCDDEDHPGNNGQKPDNGDDDNGENGENGDDDNGELGTCEEGGLLMENTIANEALGTENEEGPISSQLHENEEEFQDLAPAVHEASCVVATVDNNFPDEG